MQRLALALALLVSPLAGAFDARPATQWNAAVLAIAEQEDGFLTLKGLRTVAMMHVAMHDALSAINGHYQPLIAQPVAREAEPRMAVCVAAHHVAIDQYPTHADKLDALLKDCGPKPIPKRAWTAAHTLGTRSAQAILAARRDDGWNTQAQYQWHPMAPGVYAEFEEHSGTPKGFIFGAGWAKAKPFGVGQPAAFRAPPPPDVASAAYAAAFNEVKSVGRFQSMARTPDQTHLALWWKDFAESSHNRLARDLIARENLPLEPAVRLLALLNIAIFDAYVVSFENKFHYNHWRPYTAIRWADNDGNPATEAEATWTNTHLHTYAFPSYPSAHGTACAAAMVTLADVFGADYAFSMRTPLVDVAGPLSGKIQMQPPTRRFARFADAATECGASRIYLGIHFRYDAVEGVNLGQRVGQHIVSRLLTPVARSQDAAPPP